MCAGPGHARQAEAGERGLGSEIRRDCCCCLRAGGESEPLTRSHVRANLFKPRRKHLDSAGHFQPRRQQLLTAAQLPGRTSSRAVLEIWTPLSLWTCKLKSDWLPARHGNQGYVPTVS